ncbi:vesicle-fusing ATPase-like [Camellia sinensis]|uniref:vesicle-fusing ATPase-like n=1 Tax=Camellia sinensis TaxID=4442 RepID=UPI0010364696|nr:vesicle-fusing ATPase-like [Camellia sinensis]
MSSEAPSTDRSGTLIRGAETFKNIFREGFNMESLEEVLISFGIGGMTSQFAQILQSALGSRMVPPSIAKRLNLKRVRGMLLYGPPGARSDLHIIIFDELDSIAKAILENLHAFQIDGLKVLNNIFIIGTTNRKELIDETLLREGRIELHVKVEYPDEQGRLQILGIYTRNMRQNFVLDKDVNLHEIACRTDGCSGSTLPSLVTRAHSYVVVHTGENGLLQHVKNDFKVTMNYFLCAIEDVKSRLQESDLEPSRMGKEEMFSTEVLRMEQEIARLKENTAHFQATVEMKLETLCCELSK